MGESVLQDRATAEAVVRQVAESYLSDPNITSVGLGYKLRGGVSTGELAIQFTVSSKVAPEAVDAISRPIPPTISVNGIELPTDVIERDYHVQPVAVTVEAVAERKRRIDPIVPGVSIGHVASTAGTLGCLAADSVTGAPRLLSNWHVLHGTEGQLGDAIVQPGPFDDNRVAANVCGRLERSFVGLAGDCAIASLVGREAGDELLELGVAVRQLGDPELGDRVVKSGRTTAVTRGLVTRVHTITKIAYGDDDVEHQVGGFEIGPDPDHPADNGEISMGGDSGSAWMAVDGRGEPRDMMLGLHFAGETTLDPDEHAVACYASSVFRKLEIEPLAPDVPGPVLVREELQRGYDLDFLPGHAIDLPAAAAHVDADYAPTKEGNTVRHYTHFSLAMSAARRFCRWVAWNIDGDGLTQLSRDGIPFVLDDAYERRYQVDDTLYRNNRLDRGHSARRADLLWGTRAEAERANEDSFFFTNITPQLDDFNQSSKQGLWGELEEEIYAGVRVDALRISLFGGPIFKDNDFAHLGVLVPRSFWKVIAYVEGGTLKAKAFVLTQDDLEAKVESLGLDEFNLYQLPIAELSETIGLGFGPLAAADTLRSAPEALGGATVRRIERRGQIASG
ncbi:MAG TPA: DNA/RNA non-specific endonuclease [Conexibacter sp.]|nr:DNA/RNA non-specific endonuclease [Conexibacter sp.]